MPTEAVPDSDKEKNPPAKNNRYSSEALPNPVALELKSRWPALKMWGMAALALLIGLVIGVLVTKHRQHAGAVVGAVNGVEITQDELFGRLQKASGPAVIHQMVLEQLQLQFAAKKGLEPTDAAVNQKFDQMSKNPNFLESLKASGLTPTDYKQGLRVKMSQIAVLTQGVTVTDAEIRSFYAGETDPRNPRAQFYLPESIQLWAIATPTKSAADKVVQELASNTAIETVAAQYSIDPSKSNGGLIQPLYRGRSQISRAPALEKAIFDLKVGQQLGPISINKVWWVFRCKDKQASRTVPFDVAKDDCRTDAQILKGTKLNGKKVAAEFTDFQRKSNLQAFWPQYKLAIEGH